jgi:quercetin dioxygenase-like cupin family protein
MLSKTNSAALRRPSAFVIAGALTIAACTHHTDTQPAKPPATMSSVGTSATATASTPVLLLRAKFEPRVIRRVEIGDFHFTPGQTAPVHTHVAPAVGYVSKGSIIYQIDGQPQQILKAGDAFFEPVGEKIVHFDNASRTDEAVFTDFNFERPGEPFIVFPTPPVNLKVDRRTLPTVEWPEGPAVGGIDVYAQTLEPQTSARPPVKTQPMVGYIAEGTVLIDLPSGPRSLAAGNSFDVPAGVAGVAFTNESTSSPAKIILFEGQAVETH